MLLVAAAITSGNAAPVPVHWNAPNGTWVQTTASNPVPSGAAVRQLSPGPSAGTSCNTSQIRCLSIMLYACSSVWRQCVVILSPRVQALTSSLCQCGCASHCQLDLLFVNHALHGRQCQVFTQRTVLSQGLTLHTKPLSVLLHLSHSLAAAICQSCCT